MATKTTKYDITAGPSKLDQQIRFLRSKVALLGNGLSISTVANAKSPNP